MLGSRSSIPGAWRFVAVALLVLICGDCALLAIAAKDASKQGKDLLEKKLDPKSAEAFRDRGDSYFDVGQYRKAIDDYTQTITLNPKDAQAYANRAAANGHLGHGSKAKDDWTRAKALNPNLVYGDLAHYHEAVDPTVTSYFIFINANDSLAKEWEAELQGSKVLSPGRHCRLDTWATYDKMTLCDALSKIHKQAPGLVVHNGQKIKLALARDFDDKFKMETSSLGITCYPMMLRSLPAELEWTLAHELAHFIDIDGRLSDGREWSQLIGPYLTRYNNTYGGNPQAGLVDPAAAALGLPSGYAAQNCAEALAECTAAMVVAGWTPPKSISSFIENHLLNLTNTVDVERDLHRQALRNSEKSEWGKTIITCNRLLRLNPRDSVAYARRATAYYLSNQFKHAADDFTKSIAISPYVPQTYCGRGFVYNDQGRQQKAILDFKQAIKLNPGTRDAYLGFGFVHENLRQYQKAIADYSKAISLDCRCAQAYAQRAIAYEKVGQKRMAQRDREKSKVLGWR